MHFYAEVGGVLSAVAQSHRGKHVAFCRDAYARTASLSALVLYLLPQMIFGALHLHGLRIIVYLLHYLVDLLELKIHNVVHYALCQTHVSLELVEIEACIRSERIYDV